MKISGLNIKSAVNHDMEPHPVTDKKKQKFLQGGPNALGGQFFQKVPPLATRGKLVTRSNYPSGFTA